MKILLISTDGYSITVKDDFASLEDAKQELEKEYKDVIPNTGLEKYYSQISYLGNDEATLYANGENVYIWKIIVVE